VLLYGGFLGASGLAVPGVRRVPGRYRLTRQV
jgi:hypothetical protein